MSEIFPEQLPKASWPGVSTMYGSGGGGGASTCYGGGSGASGYVETYWASEIGVRPIRCRYCGLKAGNDIGHCDGCGAPK